MPRTGRPPKTEWSVCRVPDCETSTREGAKDFCPAHYQQWRRGLIDENGKETGKRTRLYKKGTPCLVEGCGQPAVGRGLCSRHYQQEERVDLNRQERVAAHRCRLCNDPHWARGFCQAHYAQLRRGIIDEEGDSLRPLKRISRLQEGLSCRHPGCANTIRTRGWCNKHYLQFKAGILDKDGNQLRELVPCGRRPLDWRKEIAGYILVRAPEGHPGARHDGSIYRHRLVMEEQLGRYLDPEEVVHHKNGIRDDNRPENLELRTTRKEHPLGHEVDTRHAAQALLQQENLPPALERSIRKYLREKVD